MSDMFYDLGIILIGLVGTALIYAAFVWRLHLIVNRDEGTHK